MYLLRWSCADLHQLWARSQKAWKLFGRKRKPVNGRGHVWRSWINSCVRGQYETNSAEGNPEACMTDCIWDKGSSWSLIFFYLVRTRCEIYILQYDLVKYVLGYASGSQALHPQCHPLIHSGHQPSSRKSLPSVEDKIMCTTIGV